MSGSADVMAVHPPFTLSLSKNILWDFSGKEVLNLAIMLDISPQYRIIGWAPCELLAKSQSAACAQCVNTSEEIMDALMDAVFQPAARKDWKVPSRKTEVD
ncbi:hypothetical protein E5288_WYG015511 [Bos mutus]|uniref:Uncharacterized protein n=1 Tax=Bos mutus TaxID=72004 RepID=A0A6B0RRR1_9CETA|nr:hypothetical protein [Bos mutus]